MNKELILKYKTEFDHCLNGGKLLIRNNDENIWINMTEVHWDMNYKTVSIIINDEFSELRKALCDGKIIQVKALNIWVDCKNVQLQNFSPNNTYRIKPEEPQFKVGDFVKNESIGLIKQYSLSDLEYDKTATNINNWIKWKPSHKELCYFTHDTNTKTSAILREFREISKDGFYVDCFGTRFIYCEPFLSSKPSWFK